MYFSRVFLMFCEENYSPPILNVIQIFHNRISNNTKNFKILYTIVGDKLF